MSTKQVVELEVDGRAVEVLVAPLTTLQAVLRDALGAFAVKEGCRQGGCGSCAVLVDGEPVYSCLVPVEDVAGRRVMTVAALSGPDTVHPVQQAFLETLAFQCGYCTPGMVTIAAALLAHNPAPSRDEIVDALAGNVCRCTGYEPIVAAVARAAEALAASATAPEMTREAAR